MSKFIKTSKKTVIFLVATFFMIGSIFIHQTKVQASISFPWTKIAWKVASYLNSYFYDVSGTTQTGSNWANISTGTLSFNNSSSNIGASVNHDIYVGSPQLDIDIFAETNFLNWLDKISIILTDSKGNDKINRSVDHEQHSYYKTTSYDNYGTWRVRFVENDSSKWNCWIAVTDQSIYGSSYAISTNEQGISQPANIVKTNNKIYFLPDTNHKSNQKKLYSHKLSMKDLNNEFFDDVNKRYVKSSKNFSIGDTVLFEDTIKSIKYDSTTNATYFVFEGQDGFDITWAFANDLTNIYKAGHKLSLKFKLVQETRANGFTFENINYIVDSKESQPAGKFVNIKDYK